MKHEPDILEERDPEAAAIVRARADVAAGRVVPHEKVAAWLKTWGTADEQPMPREWLE
ncbi:antitoxin [Sphingomonas endolithica]|uniref:antitoxin n=1 Tax=Sphingomonas endolithica TaxID=2972485 RepID=UPI0021AE89A2|nr:antitoxin [Sphingomonas sp. ZFBP2030]